MLVGGNWLGISSIYGIHRVSDKINSSVMGHSDPWLVNQPTLRLRWSATDHIIVGETTSFRRLAMSHAHVTFNYTIYDTDSFVPGKPQPPPFYAARFATHHPLWGWWCVTSAAHGRCTTNLSITTSAQSNSSTCESLLLSKGNYVHENREGRARKHSTEV